MIREGWVKCCGGVVRRQRGNVVLCWVVIELVRPVETTHQVIFRCHWCSNISWLDTVDVTVASRMFKLGLLGSKLLKLLRYKVLVLKCNFICIIFDFKNHFSQASKVSCLYPGSVTDCALIVYYTYTTLFTFHPATHHLNTTFRWTWVCEAAHSPTQWRVNKKVTLTHWLECLYMCMSVLRIVDASTVQQITFKRPTPCHTLPQSKLNRPIIDLIWT